MSANHNQAFHPIDFQDMDFDDFLVGIALNQYSYTSIYIYMYFTNRSEAWR